MSTVTALGYVGIRVADIDAWTKMSTEVLGLQTVPNPDGSVNLRCDERGYRAQLIPDSREGLAYLGLEVRDPAALAELVRKLEAAGRSVKTGDTQLARQRQVTDIAVVEDPDGNRVELYTGGSYADLPFVSPTGARFVTQGLGYGHAFISTTDLEASRAFYVDELGFRISDRIPAGPSSDALFLRCNPRHHSIGLAYIPNMPSTLLHIMFEVDDIDTVGFAYDKCRAGAAPIVNTLGRHSNDRMLSFYLRNPSGFDIEFGTDGMKIDETSWNAGENRYAVESFWGHKRTPDNVRGPEEGWQY